MLRATCSRRHAPRSSRAVLCIWLRSVIAYVSTYIHVFVWILHLDKPICQHSHVSSRSVDVSTWLNLQRYYIPRNLHICWLPLCSAAAPVVQFNLRSGDLLDADEVRAYG